MSLASDIVGFWSLVSRIDVDAAGHRHIDPALGADPLGVLCFAPGRFAAQFSKRDRSDVVGTRRARPSLAPTTAPRETGTTRTSAHTR